MTGIEYDMEEYLESCITRYKDCYKEITNVTPTIKSAATPFLQEDQKNAPSAKPAKECPLCGHKSSNTGNPQNDTAPAECDHKHKVILPIDEDKAKSTKKPKSKKKKTPVVISPENQGRLKPLSASVLMKIYFLAVAN